MFKLNVPFLRRGSGLRPSEGGCIMQVVDWIHNGTWTDSPRCVHLGLRTLAINVNDTVDDGERQRLLDLAPRLIGTDTLTEEQSIRIITRLLRDKLAFVPDSEWKAQVEVVVSAWEQHLARPVTFSSSRERFARLCGAHFGVAQDVYLALTYLVDLIDPDHGDTRHKIAAGDAIYFAGNSDGCARNPIDGLIRVLDLFDAELGRNEHQQIDWSPVCEVMAGQSATTV